MNFAALPDEAQVHLKALLLHLDRPSFYGDEATYEGIQFVLAAVGSRKQGKTSTLYMRLMELALDHGGGSQH